MNKNNDPWELLREARELLVDEGRAGAWDCMTLATRIFTALEAHDAALAERQNSATEVVESDDGWEDIDILIDFDWMDGAFGGHTTKLGPWTLSTFSTGRDEWLSAVAFTEPFATEAEAKAAAIAAARGMR
jgi:hypothetical protein